MAFLLMAGTALPMLTSCEEDDDNKFQSYAVVGFEEDNFTKLIDSPQNNGPKLYGGNDTQWSDKQTTLAGGTKGKSEYNGVSYDGWANGIAISNYIDADIENHAAPDYQLSVPVSNGSKNFGVVWEEATVYFADGKARQINSIDLCPTTYLLGVMQHGNGCGKALTEEGDYFQVILTADNGASINVDLALDGKLQTTWRTVALSSLGKITRLSFSFDGSDKGGYGLNTPKYVAIDNIKVSTGL